jgi:hypothetical protein
VPSEGFLQWGIHFVDRGYLRTRRIAADSCTILPFDELCKRDRGGRVPSCANITPQWGTNVRVCECIVRIISLKQTGKGCLVLFRKVRTSELLRCDTGAGSYTFLGVRLLLRTCRYGGTPSGIVERVPHLQEVSRRRRGKVAAKMTYTYSG